MRCIICKENQIFTKEVVEELKHNENIIRINVKIPVCFTCGERYFDYKSMQLLQNIRNLIDNNEVEMHEVGKIFELDTLQAFQLTDYNR